MKFVECKIIISFFHDRNKYLSLTVPGMYGTKNSVGVRNKLLLGSFGTLSGCYYLFIYAYDVKKPQCNYHFLVAKLNPYFTFPNLRHQKNWFPNISFGVVQLLSSTRNGLFQTYVKR